MTIIRRHIIRHIFLVLLLLLSGVPLFSQPGDAEYKPGRVHSGADDLKEKGEKVILRFVGKTLILIDKKEGNRLHSIELEEKEGIQYSRGKYPHWLTPPEPEGFEQQLRTFQLSDVYYLPRKWVRGIDSRKHWLTIPDQGQTHYLRLPREHVEEILEQIEQRSGWRVRRLIYGP